MIPAAITFDFWNTLVTEGPGGLFAPRVVRWAAVLEEAGHPADRESLERAHRGALAAYQAAWRRGVQFRSPEATRHALEALGVACDVNTIRRLERSFTEAGGWSDVEPVAGALDAVTRLHGAGVRLGVICDIGLTPSDALEPLLDRLGVRDRFDALVWSDRIGAYKPDPAMFGYALDRLGVPAGDAWHVGDRRRTDVAGAVAAGMTAVRFRAVYDDPEDLPDAPIVVGSYEELLRLAGLS